MLLELKSKANTNFGESSFFFFLFTTLSFHIRQISISKQTGELFQFLFFNFLFYDFSLTSLFFVVFFGFSFSLAAPERRVAVATSYSSSSSSGATRAYGSYKGRLQCLALETNLFGSSTGASCRLKS